MRIGAPYRCHSFVCGHILSRCRRGHGADHFFFVHRGTSAAGICQDDRVCPSTVWECDSLWILGDVLTAAWRAIVLSTFAALRVPCRALFFWPPLPPIRLSTLPRAPATSGTSTIIARVFVDSSWSFHFWENVLLDRSECIEIFLEHFWEKNDTSYVDEMTVAFIKIKDR